MKIIRQLTWRYMMKNKKRTLVTIFGAIISVAMLTAVFTSIVSFMDLFRRIAIEESGNWHARFMDVTMENVQTLKDDPDIASVGLYSVLGFVPNEAGENGDPRRPYFFVEAYDDTKMTQSSIRLSEGRLPENDQEIIIAQQFNRVNDNIYKIGDSMTVSLGKRVCKNFEDGETLSNVDSLMTDGDGNIIESYASYGIEKTYTIVGFIESVPGDYSWSPGYPAITWMDDSQWGESPVNVQVLYDGLDMDVYNNIEMMADTLNAQAQINGELLNVSGITPDSGINMMMISMAALLIVIIVLGSVSLIYNAFAISLSERSRQLGMLSSIGATKQQKRYSVLYEGAMIGMISIPLGLIGGTAGMAVTFACVNPLIQQLMGINVPMRLIVTPGALVGAAVLAILTILISAWVPALRASRISPIDGIRQSNDIRLTRRQIKTSRLTRLLFGFNGTIALKNLKRNKKGYRATVIALTCSLALFISISGYVDIMETSFGMTGDQTKYDVSATLNTREKDEGALYTQKGVELCVDNAYVKDYTVMTTFSGKDIQLASETVEKILSDDYRAYIDQIYSGNYGMDTLALDLIGMDEHSMNDYLEQLGLTLTAEDMKMTDSGQIPVIVVHTQQFNDNYKWTKLQVADVVRDDILNFVINDFIYNESGDDYTEVSVTDTPPLYVSASVSEYPMGYYDVGYIGAPLAVFTLDENMATIAYRTSMEDLLQTSLTQVYMTSDHPQDLTDYMRSLTEDYTSYVRSYYSQWESAQSDRALLTVFQVFCYGFMVLMTLICVANILNTVSTGIELHRREFAMLKSVGMEPAAFYRMLVYESLFYGLKTLLYGLPIGLFFVWLENKIMSTSFSMGFVIPTAQIVIALILLLVIIGIAMFYSFGKLRKENILDGLRTE